MKYRLSIADWLHTFSNALLYVLVAIHFFQVARCHIKVELKNDSFTELRGEIAGPPDTPYEGGNYILDIKIPETYPFNPPKVSEQYVALLIVCTYIYVGVSQIRKKNLNQ